VRFLTVVDVVEIHGRIISAAGGAFAVRDSGALQSAVAQPRARFEGADLYPTLEEKAAALMFSLIRNHPFVDGNKRIGHAAAEAFVLLNGKELHSTVDDAERVVTGVAAGTSSRAELVEWIRSRARPR
jgi:death-on-curing protein